MSRHMYYCSSDVSSHHSIIQSPTNNLCILYPRIYHHSRSIDWGSSLTASSTFGKLRADNRFDFLHSIGGELQ